MSQPPAPERSPLYEALNAKRYRRQELIRGIEEATNRRLLVYFANVNHPNADVSQVDIAPVQDMLHDCDPACPIDLYLQTSGGDIEAAEKIVYMIRKCGSSLRVIVAERAKSAGTLIALAADEIVMSDSSELGPIDPQVTIPTAEGRLVGRPAHSWLDGLEAIKQAVVSEGGPNPAYYPLLAQVDPALIDFCNKAIERSEEFAKTWLAKYMLQGQPDKAAEIAHKLVHDRAYIASHGKVIDAEEAQKLGLQVNYLAPTNPLWRSVWRLHLHYETACHENPPLLKAFETLRISLVM